MKYAVPFVIAASLALAVVGAGRASSGAARGAMLGANASLGGKRPFPDDNPWNQDISREPVDPASSRLIRTIGADETVHPCFGPGYETPYVVVPGDQRRVRVSFDFPTESDPGPYPIPPNAPIQGGSDHHVLVVDRDNWRLYELYNASHSGDGWHASSGAIFDLNSNRLRPAGWTSADAAGLPIFPGLVRYDETCEQQEIPHALRFTVRRTRHAFVSPARHYAADSRDSDVPPMGMRVRLKTDYDIRSFPPCTQVILRALKTYGMFVADHGANWYITGAPDSRWNEDALLTLHRVHGRDFEVVKMPPIHEERD